MASQVIASNAYDPAQLATATFRWRFLVEGDSWMDRSNLVQPSLLPWLAREFDRHGKGDALFINCAQFGDTMRRMGQCANGDFGLWLHTQFGSWSFDGILLSGGGNDVIDSARDSAPGQGLLQDQADLPLLAQPYDAIRQDALAALVQDVMDPGFAQLYDVVQSSQYAGAPIFLNLYDTPTPRFAPAIPNGRSWLSEAYRKNHIPAAHWQGLTDEIFHHLQLTLSSWAWNRPNVHMVPTDGTLTPASPGSSGSSGDWINEIHPNPAGWAKLARLWYDSLDSVMGF